MAIMFPEMFDTFFMDKTKSKWFTRELIQIPPFAPVATMQRSHSSFHWPRVYDSAAWTGRCNTTSPVWKKFLTFEAVHGTIARIMEVVMPYIKDEDKFDAMSDPTTAGELNYKLTMTCLDYLQERADADGRLSYDRINEVMGVLECAKQEFYRRVAVPYENRKCKENGDVYPDDLVFPPNFENTVQENEK